MKIKYTTSLVILLWTAVCVFAGPITVINFGFEEPDLGTGADGITYDWSSVPGWSYDDAADCGVWNGVRDGVVAAEGDQMVWIESGYATGPWQDLGYTITAGKEYIFSMQVQRRQSGDACSLTFNYHDGGDRTEIVTNVIDQTSQPNDSWVTYSLSFVAELGAEYIGKSLGIEFNNLSSSTSWQHFDDVHVEIPLVSCINPQDGETNVGVDENLEWYVVEDLPVDVYFGTDPNVDDNPKVISNTVKSSYEPGTLNYSTTYYWRVDALEPNELGSGYIVNIGDEWSFTTMPQTPVINSIGPVNVYVNMGETALFSIDATDPLNGTLDYEWYKADDSATVLSTAETLEIINVQPADEGQYYCEVSNTIGTTTSDNLTLTIKKLLGHWPFDSSLEDVVGGNDGDYTATGKVNYDSGLPLLGDAVDFTGILEAVTISTAPYTNSAWTLTWWDYADAIPGAEWESMTASGASTGYELFESDRVEGTYATGFNTGGGWVWGTGQYPREVWNHNTVTYDPSTGTSILYINAIKLGEMVGIPFTDFDSLLYVGNCRNETQFYNGLIDDLRLYNYPMDIIDVATLIYDATGEDVCIEELVYDLTGDCRVNIDDIVEFITTWMDCNLVPTCIP
jgi:hypothetical protein